jgi:hypothetical protein
MNVPEIVAKTISRASVCYAADCSFTSIELRFTDGTQYDFLIHTEPSVVGLDYHSIADDDMTQHLLHKADHNLPSKPILKGVYKQ